MENFYPNTFFSLFENKSLKQIYLCKLIYFTDMMIIRFLKNWILPIAMMIGVLSYLIYDAIDFPTEIRSIASDCATIGQPLLLFTMLFFTFCKIDITHLRFCKWHFYLMAFQVVFFILLLILAKWYHGAESMALIEGLALCIICPTATSASVITRKLGGNAERLITYTILINLCIAILIPLCVPILHAEEGISFLTAFTTILGKVFPLLLLPLLCAYIIRSFFPKLHALCTRYPDISFYLWAIALTVAVSLTTKAVVHSNVPLWVQIGLGTGSLIACLLQFYVGRRIGKPYGDVIAGGQSLGQKNTVLAIWIGVTFFTPVSAMAAGFYSIWHNLVNSYQLYQQRKKEGAL